MANKKRYVLDTSAILALRQDETGAGEVEELLNQGQRSSAEVFISFMSRMELLYLIRREEGEESAQEALRLIDSFAIQWVSCEPKILDIAGSIKALGGLSSLADCWIAATAEHLGAILIHKDPEFNNCAQIEQRMLPSS
jgi:predicted nucleic acid-binding protein